MGEDFLDKDLVKLKVLLELDVKVFLEIIYNVLYYLGSSYKIYEF